jgi:PAS domain S-box-containing protein
LLAEEHLSAIIQSSDDAIISKQLDGTVISWNPAATQIFGYEEAEMVGQSIRRLIRPIARARKTRSSAASSAESACGISKRSGCARMARPSAFR